MNQQRTPHSRARAGLAVLALGIACALPAAAQTTGTAPGGTAGTTSTTQVDDDDDGFDLGWIGLLGLAGLLGLRRRDDTAHRTTTTTGR